jgi:hypothetical protein
MKLEFEPACIAIVAGIFPASFFFIIIMIFLAAEIRLDPCLVIFAESFDLLSSSSSS